MTIEIEHLPGQGRFQSVIDGKRSVADYRLAGGVMRMTHTEVHPSLMGRGIAAALVAAALAHARANGFKVEPLCSYVRTYLRRHPEQRDLLA